MENNFTIQTGNKIVDQMTKINFSGNVIPEIWYQTIVNENGKVNLLAINILADVVYWYRPTENRDEQTGNVSYSKKFHDDELLQRSYEQLCQKFNVSNKQAREALIVLEQLGVIKRVFKTIMTVGGACPNVMFLELFPLALLKLTYPDDHQDISENGGTSEIENTSLQNCKEVFTKKEIQIQRIQQRLLQRFLQQQWFLRKHLLQLRLLRLLKTKRSLFNKQKNSSLNTISLTMKSTP